MRHYLPGLGRFISRVRLHEAVALGRTTYEELRQVWGVNIGPLGTPEAFAGSKTPEHPYAYTENNPVSRMDPAGLRSCRPGHDCQHHPKPCPKQGDGDGVGAMGAGAGTSPRASTAGPRKAFTGAPGTRGAGQMMASQQNQGQQHGGQQGQQHGGQWPGAGAGGGPGGQGGGGSTSTDHGYCEWLPPGQGLGIGRYVCHCPASQKKGWTCTVFPPPGRGGPHRGTSVTIDCSGCGSDRGKCRVTFHTWNEMAGRAAAVKDWPTKEAPCFNPAEHRGPPAGGGGQTGGPPPSQPPSRPPTSPCWNLGAGQQEECCHRLWATCLVRHPGHAGVEGCDNCEYTCLAAIGLQPGARASIAYVERAFALCEQSVFALTK
jgi:hypothetical protein